jgi:hypothetical protein
MPLALRAHSWGYLIEEIGYCRVARGRRCNTRPASSASGRYGAHNIHMNRPIEISRTLVNIVAGSYFNGGVRASSIAAPARPREIGYLIPSTAGGDPTHTVQINAVYVDEHGLIYASDQLTGGLYINRYTGSLALD